MKQTMTKNTVQARDTGLCYADYEGGVQYIEFSLTKREKNITRSRCQS